MICLLLPVCFNSFPDFKILVNFILACFGPFHCTSCHPIAINCMPSIFKFSLSVSIAFHFSICCVQSVHFTSFPDFEILFHDFMMGNEILWFQWVALLHYSLLSLHKEITRIRSIPFASFISRIHVLLYFTVWSWKNLYQLDDYLPIVSKILFIFSSTYPCMTLRSVNLQYFFCVLSPFSNVGTIMGFCMILVLLVFTMNFERCKN